MRFLKSFVLAVLFVLTFLNPSVWADKTVRIQMLRLQTADGITLTGVLRQPRTVRNNAGVVMVHGYSGNFYSGIMAFLPERLSDSGFTTLALNMRDHDRGPKKNRFEENRYDIAVAVDEMARLGYAPIFLFGHSMGTNRVLYYVATTGDSRVKGILLTAPPGNLFEWNISIFGLEAASQVLAQAQDLVAKGKGGEWMLINLGPLGKALYTANHVVSLRGPKTISDPYKNISQIFKPILIVHGLADRLANPDVTDRLLKSAAPEIQVTVVKIPGANHGFSAHQQDLVTAVNKWLIDQTNH
ncbi:MAG: alpha/beta fold hydrolase [Desulfobacterales bacterium]